MIVQFAGRIKTLPKQTLAKLAAPKNLVAPIHNRMPVNLAPGEYDRWLEPLLVELRMNAVWAIDFMRDTLYSGRVFRTLNVIDEANRGALAWTSQ